MRKFFLTSAALALLTLPASQAANAAPADSRSYVVFFENNQTTLTPEGRIVVKAAADRARQSHANLITVAAPAAHVVAGYNPALAAPRVARVQEALIANGVRRAKVARAPVSDAAKVGLVGAERVEIRVVNTSEQST
jgi:outer membrane protein OmpA-like peptidoglycan-associated protein